MRHSRILTVIRCLALSLQVNKLHAHGGSALMEACTSGTSTSATLHIPIPTRFVTVFLPGSLRTPLAHRPCSSLYSRWLM